MAHLGEEHMAIHIGQQFCDLLDNHRSQLPLFLSDDVVLHWFGRTIYGKCDVTTFLTQEIASTTHNLTSVGPSGPFDLQKDRGSEARSSVELRQDLGTVQECFRNLTVNDNPTSGDYTMQLDKNINGTLAGEHCWMSKCFKASGLLNFCRTRASPTLHKSLKLLTDTMKWERFCKLHVTYSFLLSQGECKTFELQQIVYEDITRCKRNLGPEFEKVAQH